LAKEAEANMQSASLKTQDIYKSILTEIKQVISDVKTNYDKLNAAKLHVKLAEDAVEQSKVRFENGIITNLDLINAETSLAKARLLFSQAQYSYTISQYALKRAVGEHIWTDK
jgi:outer membrane protein TolC